MSTFRAYLITPPAGPRWWGTVRDRAKSDARDCGGTWEEVDVPATKAELIPFLNALEARVGASTAAEPREVPEVAEPTPAAPTPAPAPPPVDLTAAAVEEYAMDATGAPLARIFLAAAEQVGAIGKPAWEHIQSFIARDYKRAGTVDRAFHFIALSHIAMLNEGNA